MSKKIVFSFLILSIIILFPFGMNSAEIKRCEVLTIDKNNSAIFIDVGKNQGIAEGTIFYFIDINKKNYSLIVTKCFNSISKTKLLKGDINMIETSEKIFSYNEISDSELILNLEEDISSNEKEPESFKYIPDISSNIYSSNFEKDIKLSYEYTDTDGEKDILLNETITLEYEKYLDTRLIYSILGSAANASEYIKGRVEGEYYYYLTKKINFHLNSNIEKYDYFEKQMDIDEYNLNAEMNFDLLNYLSSKFGYEIGKETYQNPDNPNPALNGLFLEFSFSPNSFQLDLNLKNREKKFAGLEEENYKENIYEVIFNKPLFKKMYLQIDNLYTNRNYKTGKNYNENNFNADFNYNLSKKVMGIIFEYDEKKYSEPTIYESNFQLLNVNPYIKYNFNNNTVGDIEINMETQQNQDENNDDTYYKEKMNYIDKYINLSLDYFGENIFSYNLYLKYGTKKYNDSQNGRIFYTDDNYYSDYNYAGLNIWIELKLSKNLKWSNSFYYEKKMYINPEEKDYSTIFYNSELSYSF